MRPRTRRRADTRRPEDPKRPRVEPPNASRGGSRGFPPEFRSLSITILQRGQPELLRGHVHPSTVYGWVKNGPQRQAMTGNHAAQVLRGEHEFLLCLYRAVFPDSTASEIIAFIARESSDHRIFSHQDVSQREAELGYTRKNLNVMAYQALTPFNAFRHQQFWSQPFPAGVTDTARGNAIDIDEFSVMIGDCNRSRGKSPKGHVIRIPGLYGRTSKHTCIVAIRPGYPLWFQIKEVAGTSSEEFNDFVHGRILTGPRAIAAHPQCTFLWDNLSSHHSVLVVNSVYGAGHRILPRPPYRPVDGPVEYVIHTIEEKLKKRTRYITDDASLYQQIRAVVANFDIASIDRYFANCGYP